MAYIIGLVVVVLFFLALHYFTETTKPQKMFITTTVVIIIMGAIAYNSYTAYERENMAKVVIQFNQNQTVSCDETDVNNTNFTLSIGTYTFIGKENSSYYGQMIDASGCR